MVHLGILMRMPKDIQLRLKEKFAEAFRRDDVKATVFTGKNGRFLGGFDINVFLKVHATGDMSQLPDVSVELVSNTLEGCHARIAAPRTQLGLPELSLGVMLGFGGTQRLPRLLGLSKAIDMILGEKECPYYMHNGSCKYGPSCRFNHLNPTAAGGGDSPRTHGYDGPLPLQPTPKPNIPNMPSWSAPRTPDPTAAFVPMMYSQTQNMPPPKPDWNGYQAPAGVPAHLYPSSEQGLPIPPAFFLNNPPGNTSMYTHQQQPMVVSEYPERPGQPDCSYFMKTGTCKYQASCKFHHPSGRISRISRAVSSSSYCLSSF